MNRPLRTCAAAAVAVLLTVPAGAQTAAPPKILLDASPRAVEYQLSRLSNADLVRLERRVDDPRYRPVFYAFLVRKGLGREYFDEALLALTKMDGASRTRVLLEALSKVGASDTETADKLLRVLFSEPAGALRAERSTFVKVIGEGSPPPAVRGAYGGLLLSDGSPQEAWRLAAGREGGIVELLRSIPLLGGAPALRGPVAERVVGLLGQTQDPALRAAAIPALAWSRPDAETFRLIAREALQASDPDVRTASVRALQAIPRPSWPDGEIEPLARAVLAQVGEVPAERRTETPAADAIGLVEKLADALPDTPRRAIRRDLRALGVQVVRIETVPEAMVFDVKWFVVESSRPVQIVLYNPDAMSHNLVVTAPGALKEVGMAGGAMAPPGDPDAKAYVPDTPLVLQATRLLNWGETARLSFDAPAKPGEYPFVCTFPGHWVRMYGVMLVVDSLDGWDATRTVPNDPMTDRPFTSPRH